jgi:hypothetical protein
MESTMAAQEPDRNNWNSPLDPVVVTTESIASGRSAVLLVIHEEGHGGWQLHDRSEIAGERPHVLPKEGVLRLDPTLAEITDLPVGWKAERARKGAPWIRKPYARA